MTVDPQPIVSDIEFDDGGKVIIGLEDRMTGHMPHPRGDTYVYNSRARPRPQHAGFSRRIVIQAGQDSNLQPTVLETVALPN